MLLIKFDYIGFVRSINCNASAHPQYMHTNGHGSGRNRVVIYNTLGLEIELRYHNLDEFELDYSTNFKSLAELAQITAPDPIWMGRDYRSREAAIHEAGSSVRRIIHLGQRMTFELRPKRELIPFIDDSEYKTVISVS